MDAAASIRPHVEDLIELLFSGRLLEAFDKYYAENVSMGENSQPPTVGFEANRSREIAFLDTIAEWHNGQAHSIIVDGDNAAIHSSFEFTNKDGVRLRFNQVSLQTWQNDKIVKEVFFYDPTSMVVAS